MNYEIKLDIFEGPLDLLLYLIRKNEIDICNIPIALITEQYLAHLGMMHSLNLDLAGEYLVLASTLVHIKSKMLLPPAEGEDEDEEGEDPRAELVQQLLEYQMFKEAALGLEDRPLLERDVFTRGAPGEAESAAEEEAMIEVGIFELVEAFRRIIAGLDHPEQLAIDAQKLSLADRINEIMDRLSEEKQTTFAELLGETADRRRIVYTFLAILELMKLRMIRAFQVGPFGAIRLFLSVEE
ncbi:MAG: segregation/condensation protein A [Proteobacteria bacterium]|nr:segregation/condensation protein A [Pseudomonadota bacterium]MBU2226956.1 segregation/condensation protein A [Pseudomonadota bacterium]MBU2260506.1 segregation/condensation protein A [Pseudomonadota bacterium]